MNADYTGKQVLVTTTAGAKYKGILQNLDITNGTITMNNITNLTPPFMLYQPGYSLSFAGNDLSELNFIEEEEEVSKAEEEEEEEEDEEEESEEEENDDKDFMKQQEHFQKELEAMRNKSKKEKETSTEPKKSSFFDSFDDEEEYGKNRYNAANARKTNYDTFGESGAYKNSRGRGNYRGRGGYRGRGNSNQRGRGGHQKNNYYNRPSDDGDKQGDILKTPMF